MIVISLTKTIKARVIKQQSDETLTKLLHNFGSKHSVESHCDET